MNPTRRSAAVALVAVLGLISSCGSGDDDSSNTGAPDSPATTPIDPDGPDATISPDMPDELLNMIGPIEVIGDPLPTLETQDFTADPAVGTPAPVVVGLGYDGNTIRIDAATTGGTMVVFLAHWCPHCNAEIPVLNELRDDDRIPDEVNIIAISTAVKPGQPNFPPDQWLDDKDWTYPAIADGIDMERETWIGADAFGVSGFPFVTLIDDNGIVVARWSGRRPASEIASLLASLPDVA